jgi:hypothetical protein
MCELISDCSRDQGFIFFVRIVLNVFPLDRYGVDFSQLHLTPNRIPRKGLIMTGEFDTYSNLYWYVVHGTPSTYVVIYVLYSKEYLDKHVRDQHAYSPVSSTPVVRVCSMRRYQICMG